MGWRDGAVQRVSAVPGTGLLSPAHRAASGRAGFFLFFIFPCKSSKTIGNCFPKIPKHAAQVKSPEVTASKEEI